jgi:hypothetical protein
VSSRGCSIGVFDRGEFETLADIPLGSSASVSAMNVAIPHGLMTRARTLVRQVRVSLNRRRSFIRQLPSSVLDCRLSYNKFGGFCVPASSQHRPAAHAILTGRVWESETIEFITTRCGDGDVVHAGTYFGDFLPALSKACRPDARVWAFEPNTENYRCAKITIGLNGLQNVVLTNAGLGATFTRLPLTSQGRPRRRAGRQEPVRQGGTPARL